MSMRIGCTFVTGLVALAAMPLQADQRAVRRDLLVAAAASLSSVAPMLAQAVHARHGLDVRFSFAGSNTLARQIVEGARVDVFISADAAQMDVVERAGLIVPATRVDVLANELVVIVGPGRHALVRDGRDLVKPEIARVAMGDPEAVPAGVYGRRWLEAAGLWSQVQPKVVPLASSPAVVAAVREGRAAAGIVYLTDAMAGARESSVAVAYRVDRQAAPPIRYPAAVLTGGRVADARTFVDFLMSGEATPLFERAGFFRPPR
jgi:molybdate transport system substrate-binding protein